MSTLRRDRIYRMIAYHPSTNPAQDFASNLSIEPVWKKYHEEISFGIPTNGIAKNKRKNWIKFI